jgi:tRNA(Ile)-lysidine synthase
LWRLGEVSGEDYSLVEEYTTSQWKDAIREQGVGYITLNLPQVKETSLGMQRNILRRAISALLGDVRDIDYAAIQRATDYLGAPSQIGECDLKVGLKLFAEGEVLWLVAGEAQLPIRDWPQIASGVELMLDVPGSVELTGGWLIRCEMEEMIPEEQELIYSNTDHFQAWIDADVLHLPLSIRTRVAGDRFQPLGMEVGSIKLSDFMVNNKVPERLRRGWPLLCLGDDIVWVPGYRINHIYRVTGQSKRVLHFNLQKAVE